MTQTRVLVQNKVMLRNLLYYYNRRFNHKSHPTFTDVIQKEIIPDIETSPVFESTVVHNVQYTARNPQSVPVTWPKDYDE